MDDKSVFHSGLPADPTEVLIDELREKLKSRPLKSRKKPVSRLFSGLHFPLVIPSLISAILLILAIGHLWALAR